MIRKNFYIKGYYVWHCMISRRMAMLRVMLKTGSLAETNKILGSRREMVEIGQ